MERNWTYSKQGPGGCNDSKTGFTTNSAYIRCPEMELDIHGLDLVIVHSYVSASYSFRKKWFWVCKKEAEIMGPQEK